MWRRFWPRNKKGKTGPVYFPPVRLGINGISMEAANDNCFWKWMFGPFWPFDTANHVRKLRDRIRRDPDYFPEDKARLLDHSDTFLALFRAIFIEKDESKAAALAPKLNQHVPEMMARCPIEALRPDQG